MTPREEALAYRIWAYQRSDGWNASPTEIAVALGEHITDVVNIMRAKGWKCRRRPHMNAHDLLYLGASYVSDRDIDFLQSLGSRQ